MKVCYFANPRSIHVSAWLSLDQPRLQGMQIWHIDHKRDDAAIASVAPCEAWSPFGVVLRRAPKGLRYAALGLIARFRLPPRTVVHAHCASGYGLAAALAGHRYIVTTYGSEVYSASKRSWLYRRLISLVLRRATVVTCTCPQMHHYLRDRFAVPDSKIRQFSLGVDPLFAAPPPPRSRRIPDTLQFVSIRSITPLYRTIELVKAFKSLVRSGARATLVLLEGNASVDYLRRVEAVAAGCRQIIIRRGPLSREQVRDLLDSSHFSVSVPDSDQLAASVLESMSRGVLPILRDIAAYEPVSAASIQVGGGDNLEASILHAMHEAVALTHEGLNARQIAARRLVLERCGRDTASVEYNAVIQLAVDAEMGVAGAPCV